MIDDDKFPEANSRKVSLRNLYLDPNNYRLIHETEQVDVPDEKIKDKDVVNRTFKLLVGEKYQNIQDLVDSFKANGYLPVDQIQVRELADGGFVVVEGNRRVAALKFLSSEYDQKSIDLGKLDINLFSKVPIVLYDDSDEVHHLTLMALKHISGNRKWGEWNQAKLLETLTVKHGLPEVDVCKRVGISKVELRRSLRALALANQYQESDYGDQFSESMFPIFREAARNPVLKDWLGWDDSKSFAEERENRELFFSLLSRDPLDEDLDTGFSGKSDQYQEPAISKRDDIVILSKILKDPGALEQLVKNRNLIEAYRTSDLIFKEKINDVITSVTSDIITLGKLSIAPEQLPELEDALGKLRTTVEKARTTNLKGVEQTSVFFDRLDSHFSYIKIHSYRCLNGMSIDKVSRVNLFAGFNNAGKTSILEAIYLLCKQNDFNGIIDVLRRRGKIPEDSIPPKWLADQLNEKIEIEGIFDGKVANVEITPLNEEHSSIERSRYLKSIEISNSFDNQKLEALIRLYQGKDSETQAETIKILSRVVFSSPFFFNEPHHYTTFYHKSVQSKLLPKIFNFIQEKLVPTIKDIRLVDEFQRFLVIDENFESSVDLASYGEGLQRVFFTSLLFASAENGVVLIDEFENAMHADLIEKFAPFINDLSKEFNVQVFLTSHSKECIDSFVKTIPPEELSDFTFHALVKGEDNLVQVREFDGTYYSKLVEVGDVDIRRAK